MVDTCSGDETAINECLLLDDIPSRFLQDCNYAGVYCVVGKHGCSKYIDDGGTTLVITSLQKTVPHQAVEVTQVRCNIWGSFVMRLVQIARELPTNVHGNVNTIIFSSDSVSVHRSDKNCRCPNVLLTK